MDDTESVSSLGTTANGKYANYVTEISMSFECRHGVPTLSIDNIYGHETN